MTGSPNTRSENGFPETETTKRRPRSDQASARWAVWRWFRISKDGEPYLFRLRVIQTPWFGMYVHWIFREDLDRDPHNHPWPFLSWVVRGGYTEAISQVPYVHPDAIVDVVDRNRWSIHRHGLSIAHRITAVRPGTVTVVLVGRRSKSWGFFTRHGFVPWREYLGVGEMP